MAVTAGSLWLGEGGCDRAHLHQLVIEVDIIVTLCCLQEISLLDLTLEVCCPAPSNYMPSPASLCQ